VGLYFFNTLEEVAENSVSEKDQMKERKSDVRGDDVMQKAIEITMN
jgi:hypothetical protein